MTGTVEKLAMPGLLFHHVSPTKDYIHDRLKPWKHYIPVRPDLKDLKAKASVGLPLGLLCNFLFCPKTDKFARFSSIGPRPTRPKPRGSPTRARPS